MMRTGRGGPRLSEDMCWERRGHDETTKNEGRTRNDAAAGRPHQQQNRNRAPRRAARPEWGVRQRGWVGDVRVRGPVVGSRCPLREREEGEGRRREKEDGGC